LFGVGLALVVSVFLIRPLLPWYAELPLWVGAAVLIDALDVRGRTWTVIALCLTCWMLLWAARVLADGDGLPAWITPVGPPEREGIVTVFLGGVLVTVPAALVGVSLRRLIWRLGKASRPGSSGRPIPPS
jgi:hypothetical protein